MARESGETVERGREGTQQPRDSSSTRQESASRRRTGSRPRPQTEKSVANKAKDLSHVPCKFFKQGACTAGEDCPFSHDTTVPGTAKPVCQWFQKGSCRFGHKCALAHILPGQPMAMDRKNKRAAQAALREAQAVIAQENSSAITGIPPDDGPVASSSSGIARTLRTSVDLGQAQLAPTSSSMSYAERAARGSPQVASRALPPNAAPPTAQYISPPTTAAPSFASAVSPQPAHRSLSAAHVMLQDQSRRLSGTSDTRSPSRGVSSRAIPTNDLFGTSPSVSANGNGSPSIFGTSPFSGSRALFMPSSYDSNEDHFGRSPPGSGQMTTRIASGGWHARFKPEDDVIASVEDDEDDDSYDEGFLPSSLNDLLTPEEMQKRSARQLLSQSVPMNMFLNEAGPVTSASPPSRSLFSSHPAHSSLHAQILARNVAPSSSFDPGVAHFGSRPTIGDMSTSPIGAPGSLPPGLAAGLSQLHLQPAKHTGETPPTAALGAFGNSQLLSSTSPGNATGGAATTRTAWNGAPLSWGSDGSSSSGAAQQYLQPQQHTLRPIGQHGGPYGAHALFANRRVSSQTGQGFHAASPLHHSVRSDEEGGDDEEIQFEVEMS